MHVLIDESISNHCIVDFKHDVNRVIHLFELSLNRSIIFGVKKTVTSAMVLTKKDV